MRKIFYTAMAVALLGMIFAGCGSAPKDTVAKVGKYTITVDDLNEAVKPMQARWKSVDEAIEGRKGVLDNLVKQKLLLLGAYKEGLDKDSVVVARISGNDDRRLITALWQVEIANKVNITDQMVKDLYDKRGTEFNAAHILVQDEALANEIAKKAKAGEDFAELATQYSKDPGSAAKGGDLGWFTVGRMVKPFEDAVVALKDGEISDPVKTNYGYHIIKRIATRTRQQEPFEKVKENLKKTLERELQGTKSMEFVDKMFADNNLKIDEKAVALVVSKFKAAAAESSNAVPSISFTDDEKKMTIATWNGGAWTLGQLDSAINVVPSYQQRPLSTPLDVENFIKGNLQGDFLTAAAKKEGIANTKEYKDMYRKEIEEVMVSTFQNQSIYGKVKVSDDDVKAYYDANPDSFMSPLTIVAVEVQVAEEGEAKRIADKVKGGSDIAGFVDSKSLRTYTKKNGGILEITERRFPNLYAAVAKAKVGDVVGPVQDRTNRWSVMKITEVRAPALMPLDQVKGRIQSKLRRELREKAMDDFIANAKKEFGVKIYDSTIAASVDSTRFATPDEVTKKVSK